MIAFSHRFRLPTVALIFALLLALPGSASPAGQARGFIVLSAGQDGAIGTPDDVYATGEGDVVKGVVDLASLGLGQADLVPSNVKIGDIVVSADPQSAPADGKTTIAITAAIKDVRGAPVPDGTAVTFSATLGTLSAISARTSNGKAAVTLVSNAPGSSIVTASCGGKTAQISVSFNVLTQVVSTDGKLCIIWLYPEARTVRYSQPWSPPEGWKMVKAHMVGNYGYAGLASLYLEGWNGSSWVVLAQANTKPYDAWIDIPENVTQLRTKIYSYLNSYTAVWVDVPQVEIRLDVD